MAERIPFETIRQWDRECAVGADEFVHSLPKLELHTHIEGTLSPELRWKLAQRNGIKLFSKSQNLEFSTLTQLKEAYIPIQNRVLGDKSGFSENTATFFELFDEGLLVLQTEEDFYDLALDFFKRCALENVRYVELFFGPHSHRHRGIKPEAFMNGYQRAQRQAETNLGVFCQWIMLFNRHKPLEEAWENYRSVALPYKDLIVGIGLAGNEIGKPPALFDEILAQARSDGFKITAHCDLDIPNTHEHIRQVLTTLSGPGADRCDHGVNIAEQDSLIDLAKTTGTGLTLCPWGYTIYHGGNTLWQSFRTLFDAGVKITINSDDPPYMMGHYTEGNLVLVKVAGGFSNAELIQFEKNSVEICWATDEVKKKLLGELVEYERQNLGS